MADSELPTPAGMTATQRAKKKAPPVGGAPAVKIPRFDEVPQVIRTQQDQPVEQTQQMIQQPAQQPQFNRRSQEEIDADMNKLKEAIEKHQQENSEEPVKSQESAGEEKSGTEDIEEAFQNMDDFEFDSYRRMMEENVLNNPARRKAIEARCRPMDVVDLITTGEVQQEVPVVPGKYIVTFRSTTGAEDLAIKRLLYDERGTPRYMLDMYSMMSLTLGLYAINRHPLPDHRDEEGNFDTVKFNEKFKLVKGYPLQLIADLSANYAWFDVRVRKLFAVDELGNG